LPHDRNIQSVTNRRSGSNAPAIAALTDPGVRSRLIDLRLEVFPREQLTPRSSGQKPQALAAFQKAEIEKWWPVIKEFGIKAE
jgi:hypothetical protein